MSQPLNCFIIIICFVFSCFSHLFLKSMQRAASSDALNTMVFTKAEVSFHDSSHLRDNKQQLSHSHSMIENGQVSP